MRRNDKAITDPKEIDRILARASVCRIAMADGDEPYVVPVLFAMDGEALLFHSAPSGRKMDILRKNNRICFEVDMPGGLVERQTFCSWGMKYKSVIGFGRASFIDAPQEKERALAILVKKYSGEDTFSCAPEALGDVQVIAVRIESVSGKKSV